jgi:hypothetical protein
MAPYFVDSDIIAQQNTFVKPFLWKNYLFFDYYCLIYSRREPNSHGFERQISAPATEKILAIYYSTASCILQALADKAKL